VTLCLEKLKPRTVHRDDQERYVSHLPSHHDTGPARLQRGVATDPGSRRRKVLRTAAAVAIVGLLVLIVALHVTGVIGAGSHG
jgi:hypothetical protein